MRIKIVADYDCAPLWWNSGSDNFGNIGPEELGISKQLYTDFWSWAAVFDAILDRDDPRMSGFTSEAAEREFHKRGRELTQRVTSELGPKYYVKY